MRSDACLQAELWSVPASPVAVGRGTVLFLDGRCAHSKARIERLEVLIGDARHPVTAHGIPLPGSLSRGDYWWSMVPFSAVSEPVTVRLGLCATLAAGGEAFADMAMLRLEPGVSSPDGAASPVAAGRGPLSRRPGRPPIAICMATYEPPHDLFEEQIASIRDQTYDNWVCVISDDASSPERIAAMEDVLDGDSRFVLSRSRERLGFYRNFERALALAPAEASYVALADQDDRWYPEKLETLSAALDAGATLAYSDMRIVARDGELLSETYWKYRRNNHTALASLLFANTVTGAASLFRRELLELMLPFPPRLGNAYHDHWIALVALALGDVRYVDRPLYDYVQHDAAALGHARANRAGVRRVEAGFRRRVTDKLRALRERRFRPGWRGHYFQLYCRIALAARVLDMRCRPLMTPAKRRPVRRLIACDASLRGVPWLAARSVRSWSGFNETFGRERLVLEGLFWRRVVSASVKIMGWRSVLLETAAKLTGSTGSGAASCRRQ